MFPYVASGDSIFIYHDYDLSLSRYIVPCSALLVRFDDDVDTLGGIDQLSRFSRILFIWISLLVILRT